MYIWGKGRAAGRVGSDFLSASAGRVGSGQRFAGSGRVGSGPRKVTRGQLCAGDKIGDAFTKNWSDVAMGANVIET